MQISRATRAEVQMRFDANISILFPGLPVEEQAAAAATAGFDAIEMWWPFAEDVPPDRGVERLVRAVGDAGVSLVGLNLSGGDQEAGQHGILAIPGGGERFRDHLDVAVGIAARLGVRVLNALYGNVPDDVPRELLDAAAVENLALAAGRAGAVGATVVVEAQNPVDWPHYGLRRIGDAIALADRVREQAGAEVGILFDVYHVQRSEGDLIARIEAHAARFAHVQIADVPGRLRPGTGEVAFERVLPALQQAGYEGFVGLEYHPSPDPTDTFAWLPPAARRADTVAGRGIGAVR